MLAMNTERPNKRSTETLVQPHGHDRKCLAKLTDIIQEFTEISLSYLKLFPSILWH